MSRLFSQSATTVLERAKQALGIKTDAAFAAFLGIKPNTLATWKTRDSLDYDLLFAKCEDKNLQWILTGGDVGVDITNRCSDGTLLLAEAKPTPIAPNGTPDDFVFIPQVNGSISAGGGLAADNSVEMRIAFRRDWIARRGNVQNMSIIRVQGDSMEPTLLSGDIVLVDHGRNVVDPHGGIYAIASGDTIMIKRLQLVYPSRKLRIIADNSRYEPIEADPAEVIINGKVIWFGRELER